MNLLEHYICKIHSEKNLDNNMYEVDITVDCYGAEQRIIERFGVKEWEEAKTKGYYMA